MTLGVPLRLREATTVRCPTCGLLVTVEAGFWRRRTVDERHAEGGGRPTTPVTAPPPGRSPG
jgi:hypothetical protein